MEGASRSTSHLFLAGFVMALAVKNTPEAVAWHPFNRLAVDSWLGVLLVLGSAAIVFYGLGRLWEALVPSFEGIGLSPAVQTALLILARVLAAAGLIYLGARLAGGNPPHGLAAGVFIGLVGILAIGLFTCAVGGLLEQSFGDGASLGIGLTLALGIGLLAGAVFLSMVPAVERTVVRLEDQGWFSIAAYKRTQGQRVRRGTILGLLVLAGCGIYTMIQHNVLGSGPSEWQIVIPFTDGKTLTLLPGLRFTVPLLLTFAAFWLAYRVVNYPVFADFLIATEAELNKVSWTTQRRLIQDTVVVLVTVILLTVFLFVVDQIWAWVLYQVGVLQISPPTGGQLGPKELPW
jgi:preprotein translocase SecE subunit